MDDTTLRHEQIECRIAELESVVDIMNKISRGEKLTDGLNIPDLDWDKFKTIDSTRPVMAGHSLGGSAAVSMEIYVHFRLGANQVSAQLAASSKGSIDFRAVVAFDPAVQSMSSPISL